METKCPMIRTRKNDKKLDYKIKHILTGIVWS
jgi:hypothetical protein